MSKSAVIKTTEGLSKETLIENLSDFFYKEGESGDLILTYNNKWLWLFFEYEEENIYNIQFSKYFEKAEIIGFINILKNSIDIELIELYT